MRAWMPLLFLFALLCSACQPLHTQTQAYVFGTLVDIQIDDVPQAQAQQAANAVLARFQQLHQQLHAWLPGELTTLNTAIGQGRTQIPVSADLANILRHAQQLSLQSGGLFNPALGKLIALWGFHQDHFDPVAVSDAQVDALLQQHASMADLEIGQDTVHSHQPAVSIDLGGYAKGYALDEGVRILQQHGIQHALINIGGNVIALGEHQGRPWRVGIQHPRQPGAIAALDLPSGWAIGTSGDYQRFYINDGVRYCHILDPRRGKPASRTQAVTVLIAPQPHAGVLSDVASKPLFIEPARASALAREMQVTAWLLIQADGQIQLNADMQKRVQWLDAKAEKHVQLVP